jgi:ElaB/YqjD/DUF883 family membrane-anchored ribosome-binding protein
MSDTIQNEAGDTADLIDTDGRVLEEVNSGTVAQAKTYIEENPIKAAMIALAVGFVIGRAR